MGNSRICIPDVSVVKDYIKINELKTHSLPPLGRIIRSVYRRQRRHSIIYSAEESLKRDRVAAAFVEMKKTRLAFCKVMQSVQYR